MTTWSLALAADREALCDPPAWLLATPPAGSEELGGSPPGPFRRLLRRCGVPAAAAPRRRPRLTELEELRRFPSAGGASERLPVAGLTGAQRARAPPMSPRPKRAALLGVARPAGLPGTIRELLEAAPSPYRDPELPSKEELGAGVRSWLLLLRGSSLGSPRAGRLRLLLLGVKAPSAE